MPETEWYVECWVNDEFDYGMTVDSFDEAKVAYTKEVGMYNDIMDEGEDSWVTKFRVDVYEVEKNLVLREESE